MATKKNSKHTDDDLSYEECIDDGFLDGEPKVNGNCISSFSFVNDTVSETQLAKEEKSTDLYDNRRNNIINEKIQELEGEAFNIRRTYVLRESTVRKINSLKSQHKDINICVSNIVDTAISYYYECFIKNN